jgi:hypothetical protein
MARSLNGTVLVSMALALLAAVGHALAEDAAVFHRPVRLQADGADIDTGQAWGHSGPCLADYDGDGLRDLIVGDFSGKFRLFRNVGANKEPKFTRSGLLMAGMVEAEVPIYCCIGSSPHFVDYDGDGKLDVISGSYDPGECYLFRGLGGGQYAARETIVDQSGRPVLRRPDQKQSHHSFGSWPVMVDWDNDGDLDLLVGSFDGSMFVRLNEGSRKNPKLASTNLIVQSARKELKVPPDPAGHAAPAIADWDNDGRWDILSGSASGAVYFYRNVGAAGSPQFAAPQLLVAEHKGDGYDELLESDAEPVPGIRSQIAVADYNLDGKLDLLVGDFCTTITLRPNLTADERKRLDRFRTDIGAASTGIKQAQGKLQDEFDKRYSGDEIYSDEAVAEYAKAYKAMREKTDYKEWEAKITELNKAMETYLVKPASPGTINEYSTARGYVWLFLRK